MTSATNSEHAQLATLSVVVPIGPEDESWRELLSDLGSLPQTTEIFLVANTKQPNDLEVRSREASICANLRWIESERGRARQLNLGASLSTGEYVWFLHADSRVSTEEVERLLAKINSRRDALYYFDLEFAADGPRATTLNEWGTLFRSRVLGLPFGDQGLCLRRDIFQQLGGFDEQARYGEDHLLVWAARRRGIPVLPVGATITTSARKYVNHGWARTTASHCWLTWRQALPQWWQWIRGL